MDEEKVLQNVASSRKKKKKKKKPKNGQDHQGESAQSSNLETGIAAPSHIHSSSSLGNTGENSISQHTDVERNKSSDIPVDENGEPATEHSDDLKRSKDSVSKGSKAVGDVSTAHEEKAMEEKNSTVEKKSSEKKAEIKNPVWSLPAPKGVGSSSPDSGRKKKKKKANGFLISEVALSDKERNNTKVAEIEENDLKRFTDDNLLLLQETKESNNFTKIVKLMYNIGLDTLRKLFMKIHPNWTNTPGDAKNLNKGRMILKHHECALFNTGDINKWDVSLITTVLLYTRKCYKKISKDKALEDAIRNIKDQKNKLISHRDSEKMTDDEFQQVWSTVSDSLVTVGAQSKDIDDIFSDDVLENGKYYRDMFLQELAANGVVQSQVHSVHSEVKQMHSKLQDMANKVDSLVSNQSSCKNNPPADLQELNGPAFDEWLRFCDKVHHFEDRKSNYILITDEMSRENLKYFSVLRTIPWKIVLDFDPSSEESGMYHEFVNNENKSSLIDMITPDEMRRHHASTINFARHFDTHKTQWMFVNGREKDNLVNGGAQSLKEWKASSLKHISRFLNCASDPEKLEKHKPVVCVILPFLKNTIPFLQLTLERLVENFDEFPLTFVGVKHDSILEDMQENFDIYLTNLSPHLLGAGLASLLEVTEGKEYRMPTFQAKLPVKLSDNQYLYLQEYLEVMYDGCEDLPTFSDDEEEEEKLSKIFNEHRESFLSGNWISFLSLYDNHDAERELGKEVRDYIQRHLDQEPRHSSIIEIRHAPGTGGTTIARRVLWNLHNSYPCAIANLGAYKFDIDDDFQFINNLADRIAALQEHCQTIPLILLDGNHSRIEGLNNKLVRVLNARGQRAVLLSCLHLSLKSTDCKDEDDSDVHKTFTVNVKLEDSMSDQRQFEDKYRNYIDKVKTADACRVFHFPLLAMLKGLEGFGTKLKNIVHESFDGMDGLRKEIAAVVAFIQLYASQETPGSFLYKAFKKHVRQDNSGKGITYEDINQLITDQLLSLMVPARPAKRQRRHASSSFSSAVAEKFTLQHPLVAEMVLQRYYESMKFDVFSLTRVFLELPVFQDSEFFSLVNALFIRNRSSDPKARFSILFEELKSKKPRDSAKLFSELAQKTGDAIMYSHAARFHAKMNPPSFGNAKELIVEAMKCKNAQSRSRIIYDFKGQILQSELKSMVETRKIESISVLEKLANEAIQSYKKARNWPVTYPVPLMGEVKVWISCIEWITKYECGGDTDKAFEFITSTAQESGAPPFFRTCIGDSFHLLDIIDGIVQTEPNLGEPMDIQQQANNLRLSLLRTFNKNKGRKQGRREKDQDRREKDQDTIRACEALCSKDKFPKSSPVELKRLQVHFLLNSGDVETATKGVIDLLLKLLEDLVFTDKRNARVGMARHLMRVCILVTGPKQYSVDKGLSVAEMWMKESGHGPMPYFYQMMIAFLMILDGNQVFYRDVYIKALEKCQEKSQDHYRRFVSTHFLKSNGEGMNRLMTKGALLTGEKEYLQNLADFWTNRSRKKLRECSGRIRYRSFSGKKKQAYIELVEGNIELYVSKDADVGDVGQDYAKGTLVYFVVSFSLRGPVANGITFEPKSNQAQSSSK